MEQPSWRKPAGVIGMLLLIAVWAILIASASHLIGALPWPIQAIIYLILGVIWILPLKPLLRWMELGQWRE
jgi:predicted membrane channel-forming protein YqfA (hemolysin III family)